MALSKNIKTVAAIFLYIAISSFLFIFTILLIKYFKPSDELIVFILGAPTLLLFFIVFLIALFYIIYLIQIFNESVSAKISGICPSCKKWRAAEIISIPKFMAIRNMETAIHLKCKYCGYKWSKEVDWDSSD